MLRYLKPREIGSLIGLCFLISCAHNLHFFFDLVPANNILTPPLSGQNGVRQLWSFLKFEDEFGNQNLGLFKAFQLAPYVFATTVTPYYFGVFLYGLLLLPPLLAFSTKLYEQFFIPKFLSLAIFGLMPYSLLGLPFAPGNWHGAWMISGISALITLLLFKNSIAMRAILAIYFIVGYFGVQYVAISLIVLLLLFLDKNNRVTWRRYLLVSCFVLLSMSPYLYQAVSGYITFGGAYRQEGVYSNVDLFVASSSSVVELLSGISINSRGWYSETQIFTEYFSWAHVFIFLFGYIRLLRSSGAAASALLSIIFIFCIGAYYFVTRGFVIHAYEFAEPFSGLFRNASYLSVVIYISVYFYALKGFPGIELSFFKKVFLVLVGFTCGGAVFAKANFSEGFVNRRFLETQLSNSAPYIEPGYRSLEFPIGIDRSMRVQIRAGDHSVRTTEVYPILNWAFVTSSPKLEALSTKSERFDCNNVSGYKELVAKYSIDRVYVFRSLTRAEDSQCLLRLERELGMVRVVSTAELVVLGASLKTERSGELF